MNFIIYCRKSSEAEDKQILSLPAQEKVLSDYAKENHLHVIETYRESASAHVIGRKLFNEVLSRLERGEAQGLIVWDESRIARNSFDGGRVVYMMDLNELQEIRKPGKTYRNTPDDKSWLQMCFMMSKKESDDKGVNVKRGLKTKAEIGWFPSSWTKSGYMWDKFAERGNKSILKDPVRFPLIRKCWELMLTGMYSPPAVLEKLNNEMGFRTTTRKSIGGKPMARSHIYRIFTDPFYYGYYEYPTGSGIYLKGRHEPMITSDEFDRVQELLGRPAVRKPQKHDFAYTGLMKCGECGAAITCEEKYQIICPKCKLKFNNNGKTVCPGCQIPIESMKNPTLLHYIYLHCTKNKRPGCTQRSIQQKDLEIQINDILSHLGINDAFKDWAIKYINTLNDDEVVTRNASLESIQNAYNDCVKRLDNLIKMKISSNNEHGEMLSDEEFRKQKDSITKEKASLEEKLHGLGVRINTWVDTAEKAFNFAVGLQKRFADGSPEDKRLILSTIGSNLILKDKTLHLDVTKPYNFIENTVKQVPEISEWFEPTKKAVNTAYLGESWNQNPLLLPRVDSDHEPSS